MPQMVVFVPWAVGHCSKLFCSWDWRLCNFFLFCHFPFISLINHVSAYVPKHEWPRPLYTFDWQLEVEASTLETAYSGSAFQIQSPALCGAVWFCGLIIIALGRWRQKQEFKVTLGCVTRVSPPGHTWESVSKMKKEDKRKLKLTCTQQLLLKKYFFTCEW